MSGTSSIAAFSSGLDDTNAVVLDIGGCFTKCGFAGESAPRFVLPSRVPLSVNDLSFNGPLLKDIAPSDDDFLDSIEIFLYVIIFHKLLTNPHKRRVVLCEDVMTPIDQRYAFAKVLFRRLNVPSVLFASSHVLSTFPLGINTALVLDIGWTETSVTPVFDGVTVLSAWCCAKLCSASSMHDELRRELIRDSDKVDEDCVSSEALSYNVLEDIAVRLCFVPPLPSSIGGEKGCDIVCDRCPSDVVYPYCRRSDGTPLLVSGSTRLHAGESLFRDDSDCGGIVEAVLSAVLACPIDMRRVLLQSILITGGPSMTPGFHHRLLAELRHSMLNGDSRYFSLRGLADIPAIYPSPVSPSVHVWVGGSIIGTLDQLLPERSISRETFEVNGIIPDWSSMAFNHINNTSGREVDQY